MITVMFLLSSSAQNNHNRCSNHYHHHHNHRNKHYTTKYNRYHHHDTPYHHDRKHHHHLCRYDAQAHAQTPDNAGPSSDPQEHLYGAASHPRCHEHRDDQLQQHESYVHFHAHAPTGPSGPQQHSAREQREPLPQR